MVVEDVASTLHLKNVITVNARAEELEGRYDFVVSRAVTALKDFLPWIWHKLILEFFRVFLEVFYTLKEATLKKKLLLPVQR